MYHSYLALFGLLLALIALWELGSLSMWAYNLERAGRLADAGMHWPEPRLADSLPIARDDTVLKTALSHITTATRWRPRHAYAHRLAGQIYAARGELALAADAFEQAHAFEPRNPLSAWESALVYERMIQVVQAAPRESILPDLASAPVEAPVVPVDTTFCHDGRPQTCYVGLDRWSQNVAGLPEDMLITADVLFMYPPARVRLSHTIAAKQPVLHFVIGLDPNVRGWKSDGATFQVTVVADNAPVKVVYERTLSRGEARQGWHPGSADLSLWAGQQVTLALHTTGGPGDNTVDDWYAWGNVIFTTREAAEYAGLVPDPRLRAAWQQAAVDQGRFAAKGDEAFQGARYAEAYRWYERDRVSTQRQSDPAPFPMALAAVLAGQEPRNAAIHPHVYPVLGRMRIDAAALQFPTSGERLDGYPGADPAVGVLLGNSVAVAVIEVPRTSRYRLTLRAQHAWPAPIQLQTEHNGVKVAHFELGRADHSWEELVVHVDLERGRHLIGVRFLNDSSIGTVDRNAVIDWLQIEPIT